MFNGRLVSWMVNAIVPDVLRTTALPLPPAMVTMPSARGDTLVPPLRAWDNAGANCIHPDLALCTTTRSAHDVG
jgi:hypothetical protein